jgi:hypothetical protein
MDSPTLFDIPLLTRSAGCKKLRGVKHSCECQHMWYRSINEEREIQAFWAVDRWLWGPLSHVVVLKYSLDTQASNYRLEDAI